MKTIGYIRVSTNKQDLDNQRLAILDYSHRNKITIDDFIEIIISSRQDTKSRKIDDLINILDEGDCLIVSELSRIGRSLNQIVTVVDTFIRKKVKLISIKENLIISDEQSDEQDIQSKVIVGLFGLFAEMERYLISQRTKQGLQKAKQQGKKLGRPKGRVSKNTKLAGKEDQIKTMLDKQISKTSIAKFLDVSRGCLNNFIQTRGLVA